MKLYFSPLACSMASRIALYEAGRTAEFVEVDAPTKRTAAGADFRAVNPLGMVPVLELDDGELLTENAAILQHVAGATDRKLQQWLSFIGTELHKLYAPLLDKTTPDAVKEYAMARLQPRLAHVAAHLASRDYLLDRYSVADGYLFTVLNWTLVTPIKLPSALAAFQQRMLARDAVARAVNEERELYVRERARRS